MKILKTWVEVLQDSNHPLKNTDAYREGFRTGWYNASINLHSSFRSTIFPTESQWVQDNTVGYRDGHRAWILQHGETNV